VASARRVTGLRLGWPVLVPLAAGAAPAGAVIVLGGTMPLTGVALLPFAWMLPRDAALEVCRPTAGHALVPAMDQIRTVGLVTLPGAFVGVLLGGGSALQAGGTQPLPQDQIRRLLAGADRAAGRRGDRGCRRAGAGRPGCGSPPVLGNS
jgi:hypothetical protein